MTPEQREMFLMILKQQDDMLATHWQIMQTIAPVTFEDEGFDGSEPLPTLQ